MKAVIKMRVNIGRGLVVAEELAVKEFESAMPLRELVWSVLEEFHLQEMVVQSFKLLDDASKQLVYVHGADPVRDMGEYEVYLVGGVNDAIGSGPSNTESQPNANKPQDCPDRFPHIACKVDNRLHQIKIYEGARVDDLPPGIRLDDTIAQLKQVIGKLEDTQPEEMLLTFQCGRLDDSRTLRQSGIKAGAELDVQMHLSSAKKSSRGTAHVFVQGSTGRTMRINVMARNGPYEVADCRLTDTVGKLKEVVCYLDGIQPCEQRLIFAGNQLDDNKTLAYYNIQNNSTIHIVLKLKGC